MEEIPTLKKEVLEKTEHETVPGAKEATEKAINVDVKDSSILIEKKKQEEEKVSWLRSKINSLMGKISNEEALKVIMSHPAKREQYASFDANKKQKFVEAVASDQTIKYWKWDDKKDKFVTSGVFGVASGEGTSGK